MNFQPERMADQYVIKKLFGTEDVSESFLLIKKSRSRKSMPCGLTESGKSSVLRVQRIMRRVLN